MGNRQWKDIPEAIYAFEIQNEAEGFGQQSVAPFNYDWMCGRASNLRALIGTSPIYISNGGGVNGDWSNLQSYYNCAALDVVAIHDYDAVDAPKAVQNGLATQPNKIVILEEFGALGSAANKAAAIQSVSSAANSLRVSWMVWEVAKPGKITKDYEFYVGDTEAWAALVAATQGTQACQSGQCPVIQNVGCYLDSSNRAMPYAVTLPVQAVASVEVCLSQCMASGFKYAGLENGNECYCSNSVPSTAASNCNMACAGNSKQLCGGAWALSVHTQRSNTPAPFPVGCFADSTNRVMTFLYRRDGITADQCLSDCHNSNYAFAGVENRNECYCSNSVPSATSSNCNAPCIGNPNQLCGGPWALSVYSNTANAPTPSSIGCYLDSANRVMTKLYQRNSVTASQCLADCMNAKYTYAGLENGNECYCSNSLPSTFASNCNAQCFGNSQQICGGSWALSVYANGVPTPPASLGCYQDNANRVMKSLYTQDFKLTAVQCLNDCSKAGYSIAGLEFGQECYCSNSLPSTTSTNCNMGCTGNPNQVCGGPYALSLYSYNQITPPPIGCYQDNANRVMLYLYSQSQLTVEQCRQDCNNAGFAYAGLEFYRECYCSNSLPSTTASNCNAPCAGNQNQLCGGSYALSVYLTH
ncbi:WSC domain-containing protein [Chytriomyces sp. MP71]|nr:WSC domain-containing protein [Chytriomyces sp. MP71]